MSMVFKKGWDYFALSERFEIPVYSHRGGVNWLVFHTVYQRRCEMAGISRKTLATSSYVFFRLLRDLE